MSTEVELKYLILSEDVSKHIQSLLTSQKIAYEHKVKSLKNCYFDTPDLALRRRDIGLRIRAAGDKLEQTIKTAGRVIGGLHQRPEYNVNIEHNFPQLSLFPDEIWSSNDDYGAIQAELISLFNTNFTRQTWLLEFDGSQIEMAYDQGEISAGGNVEAINEVELELISGDTQALLAFANHLFNTLDVRAGIQSKAARGYRLYSGNKWHYSANLLLDAQLTSQEPNAVFIAGIERYLTELQQAIESYLQSENVADLAMIVDILSILRHGFWLFDEQLQPEIVALRQEFTHFIQLFAWVDNAIYLKELMNKTGNYRKKLDYSDQLIQQLRIEKQRFPDVQMTKQLLHSERFNRLQLNLLRVVIKGVSRDNFLPNEQGVVILSFAQQKLSDSLRELVSAMTNIDHTNVDAYLQHRKLLHRCLLTGNWFGFLFDQQLRHQFRAPWLDMQQGLRELQSLWIIRRQLEKLDVTNDESAQRKIVSWQQRKVDNLLVALAHTKDAAMAMPAYWLH